MKVDFTQWFILNTTANIIQFKHDIIMSVLQPQNSRWNAVQQKSCTFNFLKLDKAHSRCEISLVINQI